MTEQGNKRRKLVGGTYNGDIVSVDDTYSVVITVDQEVVTREVRIFHVPKRSNFLKALKDSGEEEVCISGLKFENVSKSVVSEFQLDCWDLKLDAAKAYVNIYFGGEIEVVDCQLQYVSEGCCQRPNNTMTEKNATVFETDALEYKCLAFRVNLEGFWVETTDQIRVILTFPSATTKLVSPVTEAYENEAYVLPFEVFFLSKELSDISVSSNNETWPAHKIVLAHCSDVFKQLVQTEMKEAQEGNIKLDEFDPRAVKEMLRFIYTGKLKATAEISVEIFKLAHTYAIKGIRRQVLRLIVSTVTLETAPDMYSFGELYDVKVVMARALSIAKANKKCLVADDKQLKTLMETHPKFIYQLLIS